VSNRDRKRDRKELAFLIGGLTLVLLLLGFASLSDLVVDGGTKDFDDRVLRALRQADDPSLPIGPAWLRGAALDITALGSASVLGLVVGAVVGFMLLQGLTRTAFLVFVASTGGLVLNSLLKELFQRPRPEIVPHLREVLTLSFPSGHAMTSAAVYLTLGALVMRVADRPVTRMFCMGFAMFLAGIIGVSRVYLGVHYPTDVLAGWLVGLSWALLCWLAERAIERRRGVEHPVR
jgi:undecaprenyl-diphosphatase